MGLAYFACADAAYKLVELVNSSDQGGSLAQGSAVANVRERVATLKEASRHSDGQSASVFSKLLGMADSVRTY